MEKPEWCGYPTAKKRLKICLAVSTEYHYRRVTGRQTDGQRDGDIWGITVATFYFETPSETNGARKLIFGKLVGIYR